MVRRHVIVQSVLARRKMRTCRHDAASEGGMATASTHEASEGHMLSAVSAPTAAQSSVRRQIARFHTLSIRESVSLTLDGLLTIDNFAARNASNWRRLSCACARTTIIESMRRWRRTVQLGRRLRGTQCMAGDAALLVEACGEGRLRVVDAGTVWRIEAIEVQLMDALVELATNTTTS